MNNQNQLYQNQYPYQYLNYWYVPYDNTAALRAEINELRERVAVLEKQK